VADAEDLGALVFKLLEAHRTVGGSAELDAAAVSKAVEMVRQRGGARASKLADKVVLVLEHKSCNAKLIQFSSGGDVYRFDLNRDDAGRLAAQLILLLELIP